jgi:hypothetical protein
MITGKTKKQTIYKVTGCGDNGIIATLKESRFFLDALQAAQDARNLGLHCVRVQQHLIEYPA